MAKEARKEAWVKERLKKWLKTQEPHVKYFMHVPTGYGEKGVADFIICAMGRYIAIETKSPSGKGVLHPHQQRFLDAVQKSGGVALVTADPDEAIALVDRVLNEERDKCLSQALGSLDADTEPG